MAYIYDLSDTWNAAGTTFFGIKMNVTNSASASGSKLLSLQVAGTEYFGVDKDGNVTIGNGGDLNISSATGGDASKIYNDAEDLYFQTNGSTRLLINSSGNIGIGNTSPGAKLDVTGNIRLSASSPNIELNNGGPMVYSTASNTLMFATGGGPSSPVERMRIDSSGNLLVGKTATSVGTDGVQLIAGGFSGFSAPGTTALFLNRNTNDGTILEFGRNGVSAATMGLSSSALTFGTAGSERMRIDSSGKLLVGTASTFDNVSYLKFQSLGGVSTKIAGTSLTSQMSFFNDNGRVGWIGTDGTITSYNITSDERLKENIADADDASGLIDAIQVRKFDWKANGSHQRYGFIAQELIKVAPEAVSAPPEEDEMMAVDYSKLVPLLVKELQSVRARLAALEGN